MHTLRRSIIVLLITLFFGISIRGVSMAQGNLSTASLDGTVTNIVGDPLDGIEVSVYTFSGSSWVLQAFTETDTTGSYSFSGLPAGTYRLKFFDWGQVYAYEYFEDATTIESAADIVLADGQAQTIDAALELGGKITGTLTGPGGAQVQNAMVFLFEPGVSEGNVIYIASMQGNQYTFGGLPTGEYVVRFNGQVDGQNYGEYYQDRYEISEADSVSVNVGFTTGGIDGVVGEDVNGSVSGVVRDQAGVPLPDIQVVLYRQTAGAWQVHDFIDTTSGGAYAFTGLPSDTYRLGFTDYSGNYAFEYYDNAGSVETGADLVVSGSAVSVPDVILDPAARIGGTLTDPDGNPLDATTVTVFEAGADESTPLFLTNAADGSYEIGGLRSGDYIVRFTGRQALNDYLEYYDNEPNFQSADPISVITGTLTSGIDAVMGLSPGGTIAGQVTDIYGYAFDSAKVEAYSYNGSSWVLVAEDETGYTDPAFSIDLPAGDYRLRFEAASNYTPQNPIEEYYDDVLSIDAGADVTVVFGETTGQIQAFLGNYAEETISGVVQDESSGAPLSGVQVYLYDQRFRPMYQQGVVTGADGSYTISGVWPGKYYVEFFDPAYGYSPEYYGGSGTPGGAQGIIITDTSVLGIDAQLTAVSPGTIPGSIGGTVTDEQGAPVSGVRAAVYDIFGDFAAAAYTNQSGDFLARGLADGNYQVEFTSPGGFYVSEWFDDSPDQSGALTITVSAGATTGGIDAALALAGGISGTVTDPFGNPYPLTYVTAYQFDGQSWEPLKSAGGLNESGYRLTGLLPGVYRVGFYGSSWSGGNAQTEFYDDVQAIENGTDITVTGGLITSGIDAVLGQGPAGSISGTVLDGDGNPAAGIEVILYEDDFSAEGSVAVTDENGAYTLPLLYSGIYFVEFSDPDGLLPGEFYNDAPTLNFATPISVGGAPATGIDAVLDGANGGAGGGSIAGTVVSDADGTPLGGIRVDCYDAGGAYVSGCGTSTLADGTYFLGGFLPAGDYFVRFQDLQGGYVYEYYDDVLQFQDAISISVSLGATSESIDAGLEPAGTITGTVSDAGGAPYDIAVISAFAFNGSGWDLVRSTTISQETAYTLSGLPGGVYRIGFSGASFSGITNPDVEYYDGVQDIEDGTDVTVTAGEVTPGINASIGSENLGGMSGQVTGPAGIPLENIQVRLVDDLGFPVAQTATVSDGSWAFSALSPDTYYVHFVDAGGTYVPEFYDDAADLSAASPVAVTAGVTTAAIDASLEAYGGLSGNVLDTAGQALDFVQLTLYTNDGSGWTPSGSVYADPAGAYSFGPLAPDVYRLEITGYRLQPFTMYREYYDNAEDIDSADDISLLSGMQASVDIVLGDSTAPQGAIMGQVLDESGSPVEGILAILYWQDRDGQWWQMPGEATGPDGTYLMDEILGSQYRICFADPVGEYAFECFDDAGQMSQAQDIDVPAEGQVTGVDAVLAPQLLPYRIYLPLVQR